MVMFVLNTKRGIPTTVVYNLLKELFSLKESDIDILTGDKQFVKVRYEKTTREYDAEFTYQIVFYIKEELCFESKIYNDLQLALPLANEINDEVVIHDQSNNASRWILVKPPSEIYVCYELIDYEKEFSFEIDRSSLRKTSIKKALSVLPSKSYVETLPENRPVFYNQDKDWSSF